MGMFCLACSPPITNNHFRIRYDPRTRNDRAHLQNQAWAAQLTDLAHAYLKFKAGAVRDTGESEGKASIEIFSISLCSESFPSLYSSMALMV